MINRQSDNVLSNIHNLVTWHYGQNYPFNGCMAYLMECLGEDIKVFDYWFFGGITGDNLTQIYGHNYTMYCDCISVVMPKTMFIKRIFDTIGYQHSYVTKNQINSNKDMYMDTVMDYIDKGVPVIVKSVQSDECDYGNYNVICGYEENGKTLLYLDGDSTEPAKISLEEIVSQDWIFVGKKIKEIDLVLVYREAVMNIPFLLGMSRTNNCTFGANAFRDWANDIENGRYDNVVPVNFDEWRDYNIYICNLATNSGGCQTFLQKALELNPDLTFIEDIKAQYSKTGQLWKELEEMGGGFNITLETLKNKKKALMIANKLREVAVCFDEIVKVYLKV